MGLQYRIRGKDRSAAYFRWLPDEARRQLGLRELSRPWVSRAQVEAWLSHSEAQKAVIVINMVCVLKGVGIREC